MAVCAADFVIFSPNDTMCSCPTLCYDCFVEHVLYLFFLSFLWGGGGGGDCERMGLLLFVCLF